MRNSIRLLAVLALLMSPAACVTAGGERAGGRQADRLTTAEIEAVSASNAFEVVQVLRPQWLQPRGPQNVRAATEGEGLSGGDIKVYLNGSRMGGVAELQHISAVGITSMRFLDAARATQRWGTGHTHGAIIVSTDAGARR